MKSLEDRIEAMRRSVQATTHNAVTTSQLKAIAQCFAPELFDGTAWIAPWETDIKGKMGQTFPEAYSAMRDAFLHPEKAET